jgi:hypothetical protein
VSAVQMGLSSGSMRLEFIVSAESKGVSAEFTQ